MDLSALLDETSKVAQLPAEKVTKADCNRLGKIYETVKKYENRLCYKIYALMSGPSAAFAAMLAYAHFENPAILSVQPPEAVIIPSFAAIVSLLAIKWVYLYKRLIPKADAASNARVSVSVAGMVTSIKYESMQEKKAE